MESPQLMGDAEECQSSESGWTMYIGSPTLNQEHDDDEHDSIHRHRDHDDDDDNINHNHRHDNHKDDDHHNTSSDEGSMASDASSGPSHQMHLQQYSTSSWEIDNHQNRDQMIINDDGGGRGNSNNKSRSSRPSTYDLMKGEKEQHNNKKNKKKGNLAKSGSDDQFLDHGNSKFRKNNNRK